MAWAVRGFAHPAHVAHEVSCVSQVSHLDIYRSLMVPLWDHRAQNLVMCGIDLVLLLLLLIFCNTLLSYSLVLIRTITATDIPARCNTLSTATQYDRVRQ